MSTSLWSFIAAGALTLFAIAGFGIGYLLSRAPQKKRPKEEPEE